MPRPIPSKESLVKRFWSRVNRNCANGCWEWTVISQATVPEFWWYGRAVDVTRISVSLHLNRSLNGRFERVYQKCGNRLCVNPDHLVVDSKRARRREVKDNNTAYPRFLVDKFWSRVKITNDETECWVWLAGKSGLKVGYGTFWNGEKDIQSHRFALELKLGRRLKDKEYSLHKCDNPPCCNPSRLFVGSHLDNMRDKMAKGRHRSCCGSNHPMAKLTEKDVLHMRAMYGSGEYTKIELSRIFGVTITSVCGIISRESWRHV